MIRALTWSGGKVTFIDQTQLPTKLEYITTNDPMVVVEAIQNLRIRGAPLIGIAAAFGIVLGARKIRTWDRSRFQQGLAKLWQQFADTRPTAINLFWALGRMKKVIEEHLDKDVRQIRDALLSEAKAILHEDEELCLRIGQHGSALIEDGWGVLTHCNAGSLATGGIGTALGIIYDAHRGGKKIRVYVDETRPLLQGARLTAWELLQNGIEVILICDSAAASLMAKGQVDGVVVGADRIARNGDVANKIGTYNLAVLCQKHRIPFYVAAPTSSIDSSLDDGTKTPVEERDGMEVVTLGGKQIAPKGVKVYNPAFDVTPAGLVTAIITEKGICRPPYYFR